MKRILVVEDNLDLAFGLRNNLEIEGYAVEVAHDGLTGASMAVDGQFDLVILDIMLPEFDGFRVLRRLRESGSSVPVLILTAKGEESDKVRGFRLGADDYVTKPFGLLELLARVEARLRRSSDTVMPPESTASLARMGNIEIHLGARRVTRGGVAVELTPKEYDLLVNLYERRGQVVSRLDLMRRVWGYSDAVISRTIDSHVAELRRKLEDNPARPRFIFTVRKVGYRMEEEPDPN